MQFDVIARPEVLWQFWQGLWVTLWLLGASLLFGGAAAIPLALARAGDNPWLSRPVWLFTYFFRGTPMLIQVYLIYYGIAQLDWVQARWDQVWPWTQFKEPAFCAVLAFAINTCAYTVELLAGAIRDIPPGEVEAARAIGMSPFTLTRRVLLPAALRRALPAYSNEVIMMLHGTSLASVVPALTDITGAARAVYSDFYLPFEAFLTAGVMYLLLTFALVGLFRLAERRWLAHLQPRSQRQSG